MRTAPPLDISLDPFAAHAAVRPREWNISMSEVLAALSRALDLTEGQPLGHSVRACAIGMRLGASAGLGENQLAELYYALLLKDAGCSSNAARMSAIFGSDDRQVKPRLKVVDWDDQVRLALETWRSTGMGASLFSRMHYFLGIARQENVTRDLIAARCERGADIAQRLGFPNATVEAVRTLDEHWNGNGHPHGMRGDEIPLMGRIVNIAQTVEVFLAREGMSGVENVLRERRGRWFDPALTDQVLGWITDAAFWSEVQGPEVDEYVLALEPGTRARSVNEDGLTQVAEAFAEIIDAKSPFTYQHSSRVATFAGAIGRQLGFDPAQLRRTRRAGLLHDIGKVGISNRVLDKSGPLTAEERRTVEDHPRFTWEILGHVSAFSDFARQAATHHEKLDGSGYPWKLRGEELDTASRALVVADMYEALTANRPYRAGLAPAAALAILSAQRGARLDSDVIDALEAVVLAAGGADVSLPSSSGTRSVA